MTDTATVTATSADPMPGNNTATQMTTVGATADLAIAITDAPDPVALGGAETYTVTVANNGPAAATSLTVTDTLPAGTTFVSATGTGWTCTQAGAIVTCTRPALAVGTAPPIAIVVTAPAAAGTITDTASVAATTLDPAPANNTATATTTVGLTADLAVAIVGTPDPIAPGGAETYTVTVTNNGPSTATSVTVTDTLPAGATFVSAAGAGWLCTQAAGVVTCTLATLPPGGAEQLDGATAAAEELILALRLDRGISAALAAEPPFASVRGWAETSGLIESVAVDREPRVRLTLRGRLLSNELFARLV